MYSKIWDGNIENEFQNSENKIPPLSILRHVKT